MAERSRVQARSVSLWRVSVSWPAVRQGSVSRLALRQGSLVANWVRERRAAVVMRGRALPLRDRAADRRCSTGKIAMTRAAQLTGAAIWAARPLGPVLAERQPRFV
jgi:hypothetical protein